MYVAGIDAHSSYLVVAVVSKSGELLERRRVRVAEPKRLLEMLSKYRPLTVVVETSSSWPWLYDCLEPQGISFVLAHARRLRLIAESTYKSDEVDAELIARMHLAGLIPAVHPKFVSGMVIRGPKSSRCASPRPNSATARTTWVCTLASVTSPETVVTSSTLAGVRFAPQDPTSRADSATRRSCHAFRVSRAIRSRAAPARAARTG